jgi:hypothetical protein
MLHQVRTLKKLTPQRELVLLMINQLEFVLIVVVMIQITRSFKFEKKT